MKLIVGPESVRAEDADDLNALSIEFRGVDPQEATAVLRGYGRVDDDHVWLDIESLRTFAPVPRGCSWDDRFAKAMAFAREQGWTDETGALVRAHVSGRDAS